MAIRALPALLLILFLPHPLEASEADYIGDIDYSGIEVSESLAIHLAAEAHRKALGLAQFRYDRATAKKITRVEWPDGYYDLPPGDDGGYTKFHTAYWDVTFWGIKENMVGFHGGGALVNIRTGEVEIMGGVIEHFKSNELRDGQAQVIPEGGERGFPMVKNGMRHARWCAPSTRRATRQHNAHSTKPRQSSNL